jgi:branched-subunit amino acid ABC-type transport system permease component
VINLIHGSFIVLGAYLAFGLHYSLHLSPWYAVVVAAPLLFVLGYLLQWLLLNRVTTAPVLVTLTLTFGLDLILNNAMIYYFKAGSGYRFMRQPVLLRHRRACRLHHRARAVRGPGAPEDRI